MKKLCLGDLKIGHLIFQSSAPQNDWETAVKQSHQLQNITHVGIITNHHQVVEATFSDGVTATPIVDFLKKAQQNWVYVFNRPQIIDAVCNYVNRQLGQPYNDCFLEDAAGFYCSELIVKAANYASPHYFLPGQLNFTLPHSQTIAPYWADYYRKRNIAVPQGKPGSHPAGLTLQCQAITLVGYFFSDYTE